VDEFWPLKLVALDVDGVTRSFLVFAPEESLDDYWEDHAEPLLETLTFPD
jgi:hypothetical protein